ncbi:Ankyrin repeat-containing protein [Actinidia chinensis var. chinensis]|uniref:Ankyrin repeat-containing protein n=1 Tax=Actinidia chinensis var. chinensis TaxID=1590841 RepID=A0A2R6S2C3_ACTCC|nr:Ankyrin repeat-containing protein [Actinidia chinensis var. chinensis]
MQGHVDFAKTLLSHKPDLVTELDSHGRSPLHLASANGYVEIVKLLLAEDTSACAIRDEDGRTPLHLAAMKGRVEIVTELAEAKREVTRFVLDRGETVLHLCVVYNRLEALKVLVGMNTMADCVNVKDDDGNTILHIATMLKQVETVKHLLRTTAVEVNELNGSSITALDIIQHMPRDLKAVEIQELLVKAGGVMAKRISASMTKAAATTEQCVAVLAPQPSSVTTEAPISAQPPRRALDNLLKHLKEQDHRLNRKRDSLMVVATLIAAMAFQAGLSPPGGLWQEDKVDPVNQRKIQEAGKSIMADRKPYLYKAFWIPNTLSFVASLTIIFLLVSGLPTEKRVVLWILTATMWVTIISTTHAYIYALAIISPLDKGMTTVFHSSADTWLGVLGIVFLGHTYRFVIWIIRKWKLGKLEMAIALEMGLMGVVALCCRM